MKSDSYPTDNCIMNCFEDWFDPCPLNDNPSFDGLSIPWLNKTYVNPPYSNPLPWVEKAIEESNKGKLIVMLLKMDTSTKYFMKLKEAKAKFLWINGRLKYGTGSNAPFPSMLVILQSKKTEMR